MGRLFPLLLFLLAVTSSRGAGIAWVDDEIVDYARRATVTVVMNGTSGVTGFFASNDGLVVTSANPLEGATELTVITSDRLRIDRVKVLAIDTEQNLAVLTAGARPPAHLKVRKTPASPGDPCAILYSYDLRILVADGALLSRRRALDWTEASFTDLWCLQVPPDKAGLNGAPVITRDGSVAALCNFVIGAGVEKRDFALPESAINAVLDQARAAKKDLPLPLTAKFKRTPPPQDRDYYEGLKLHGLGDLPAARARFLAAYNRQPQNPVLISALAGACMVMGDKVEAEKLYRESARLAPDKILPQINLGILLEERGDRAAALSYYQDLTTRFPDLPQAWGGLSSVLYNTGRKDEALAAARKYTTLQPDSIIPWNGYARMLELTGNTTESARIKDKARELEAFLTQVRNTTPQR